MSYDRKPSVALAELWERESQHGNRYFAGFMGGVSVALLFDGERDHPTRPGEKVKVWRLVVQERERREGQQRPALRPQGHDPASPRPAAPPSGNARPGGPQRPFRREGNAARRERVAGEIVRERGADTLDNPIPFVRPEEEVRYLQVAKKLGVKPSIV